ncbi:MAG: class I SAM-dependent methyltransferase [Candidatus Nanopelagicales bacterium]|nr:class I SAM-dependent methyltransferase [Candidatus Nanopelagicales bacterium]
MSKEASELRWRRRSFGATANEYHRYRPEYPAAIIDAIVALRHGRGNPKVLDLGAGTGLMSAAIRDQGLDVVALEPDERMHDVLGTVVGPDSALIGSAEEIPLPNQSVDVVIAAQMWHWVDPARGLPEVARVLRPGGVFAIVWNLRDDRVDWVRQHSQRIDLMDTYSQFDDSRVPSFGEYFGSSELIEVDHGHPMDADRLVGLLRTHSLLILRGELDQMEAETRRLVAEHPDLQGNDEFELPYVCKAFVARRA